MVSGLFDLSGRRVLVVGGTSGLGKAAALAFAQAGAHTVATGRRVEEVQAVTDEILGHGVKSVACPCDATSKDDLAQLRGVVLDSLGGLDVLVYAAGRTLKKPTAEIELEDWQAVQHVNVDGALLTSQTFYPDLKASKCGRVVMVASLSSTLAFFEVAAYSASKAAVSSLTRSLACEWAKDGIMVNAVVPGVFPTDLNRALLEGTERGKEILMRTPMGRFGEAHEVAGAILFLASEAAGFVTGVSLPVDGGYLASGVNQ